MAMTLETLQKLVKLDVNDPLSRFALGKKLYELSQNLPEAAEHLRFSNARDPSHLATYHLLAKVLIALGQRDEARTVLLAGIEKTEDIGEGMGRDLGPAMRAMLNALDGKRGGVAGAVIRPGTTDEVVGLRWKVLRVDMPREAAMFPGDDASSTIHAVADVWGEIVCCATLMEQDPPESIRPSSRGAWRLRGMATDEKYRSLGLGAKVLAFLEAESLRRKPHQLLWCNARIGAVPFYRRAGWEVVEGEPYEIPTAGLHYTMVRRLGT